MMLMTMEFPLDREIMTTVRLAVGGVCSLVGFGIDLSEDCKVCVTESLLLLLHGGCTGARVRFFKEDGLKVTIEGEGGNGQACSSPEEEISVALLTALVEDLSIDRSDGNARISFGFKGL